MNADPQSGNAQRLGNLLNTLDATPANLATLNNEVNGLLAKVVGVLNATSLVLPANALASLSQVLQTLALPNLVNPAGTATAPVLNLDVASTTPGTPPVDVNLLVLVVTTSNIHAQLNAVTGNGQILGNLVYKISHLLDPGGSASGLIPGREQARAASTPARSARIRSFDQSTHQSTSESKTRTFPHVSLFSATNWRWAGAS